MRLETRNERAARREVKNDVCPLFTWTKREWVLCCVGSRRKRVWTVVFMFVFERIRNMTMYIYFFLEYNQSR